MVHLPSVFVVNFGDTVVLERLLNIALSHLEHFSMSVIELCFSELRRELLPRIHEYMLRLQTCVFGLCIHSLSRTNLRDYLRRSDSPLVEEKGRCRATATVSPPGIGGELEK